MMEFHLCPPSGVQPKLNVHETFIRCLGWQMKVSEMLNLGSVYTEHIFLIYHFIVIWVKVFKNGASEICGRQPLKKLK